MPNPSDLMGLTRRSFQRLQELYRRVKRLSRELAALRAKTAAAAKRAHPIALAKTRAIDEAYPEDLATPGYLVYGIEFVGRTFAETAGEATPTDAVWTGRFRKAITLRKTKGFPVGTLCVVFRIGRRLYLEPIADDCLIIPALWSDVTGWVAGERQVLMHAPDECPAWVTVSSQPCPEESP